MLSFVWKLASPLSFCVLENGLLQGPIFFPHSLYKVVPPSRVHFWQDQKLTFWILSLPHKWLTELPVPSDESEQNAH